MPSANRPGSLLFAAFAHVRIGTSAGFKLLSIYAELEDSGEWRVVASRFGELRRRANNKFWRAVSTSMEPERRATG